LPYGENAVYFKLTEMGRLRLIFLAFEFWTVIAVFVPILLSGIWFGFRGYFVAQNDLLAKYKPTIDTIALLVAVASLVIGYINLMHELRKISELKVDQSSQIVRMQTKATGHVNMRKCAQPSNDRCPILIELPPRTELEVLPDTSSYFDQQTGNRSVWKKVKYKSSTGWVNESLLWPI
jgi:hypothetical protein